MSLSLPPPIQEDDLLIHRLLNRLLSLPFDSFAECICTLLTAMGYLDPHPLGRRHFKGGYGGRGSADLGLSCVIAGKKLPGVVMLKQYRRRIQKRFLYELRGLMVSSNLRFGLVITTSAFRPGSVLVAAQSNCGPIDLIDGTRLAKLLIEHRIGVVAVPQPALRIDEAFFAGLTHSTNPTV